MANSSAGVCVCVCELVWAAMLIWETSSKIDSKYSAHKKCVSGSPHRLPPPHLPLCRTGYIFAMLVCVRVCVCYLCRVLESPTFLNHRSRSICLLYHQKLTGRVSSLAELPENLQPADPAPCERMQHAPQSTNRHRQHISDHNLFAPNASFMFGNWTLRSNDMRRNGRENERVKCTHRDTLACERTHTHAHTNWKVNGQLFGHWWKHVFRKSNSLECVLIYALELNAYVSFFAFFHAVLAKIWRNGRKRETEQRHTHARISLKSPRFHWYVDYSAIGPHKILFLAIVFGIGRPRPILPNGLCLSFCVCVRVRVQPKQGRNARERRPRKIWLDSVIECDWPHRIPMTNDIDIYIETKW